MIYLANKFKTKQSTLLSTAVLKRFNCFPMADMAKDIKKESSSPASVTNQERYQNSLKNNAEIDAKIAARNYVLSNHDRINSEKK